MSVHDNYIISITDENYYIQAYPITTDEILVICRVTNECSISSSLSLLNRQQK
jgi:hypothetical protein